MLKESIAVKRIGNFPDKPTIVFLHDSLGCIELWRNFPEKLGALTQCNVLVYDRIGYGKSPAFTNTKRDNFYMEREADLLNELLGYWRIDEAILFGHSDGGSIALIAAAKYPEKIKCIITEGAHVFVEDVTLAGIEHAIQLYHTTDLKQKLEKYHAEKTEEMFYAWAHTWKTAEYRSWNIERFLPMITCSSLIIQGEDDEYGTHAQVKSITGQTKGKSIELMIEGVKHTPHKEVPELILNRSAGFITGMLE